MEISGQTKLTGIIGNPVDHTLSPAIQNAAFEASKVNWVYVPLHVMPKQLSVAIEMVRNFFQGVNITMPYKQDVIPYLDEVSSYAKRVGAVNTIKVQDNRLIGFNTDGRGFLHALEDELEFNPKDKEVVLIGAGGAARSIATMLALSGIKRIIIANRNIEKAQNLGQSIVNSFKQVTVDVLSLSDDLPKFIKGCDLIINATPLGMKKGEIPVKGVVFNKEQYVADLIYQPEETDFLTKAKKAGAKTMSGKAMLVYQGAASFEVWTHHQAPVKEMMKALEQAVRK